MDLKALKKAVDQISEEKGIDPKEVFGAVEAAIASAYRREYGERGQNIRAELDMKTGAVKFFQVKTVVDETTARMQEVEGEELSVEHPLPLYNSERHILLHEARETKPDAALGDTIEFPLEAESSFGRIASQSAKQVVLQRLREVERETVRREYAGKENTIVSGIVQRVERGNAYIDLGKAVGIMFRNESIPGEHLRSGERLRFYLLAVQDETSRIPGLILSRANPQFVVKLFEMEVPELAEGIVEVKGIAREAGSRTKIAVTSHETNIDPIGSLVGQRGTRVMTVTNELGNEKIDIVEWSEDPAAFIASALSPAKSRSVDTLPRREARVLVPEDQLSLAIGRGGQNVRLAAKLTGWKIDVRHEGNPEEVQEGGIADSPNVGESSESKGAELPEKPDGPEEPISNT